MDNAAATKLIKAINDLNRTLQHQNHILIEWGKLWKEANDSEKAAQEGDGTVRIETERHADLGSAGSGDADEWRTGG